MFLCFGPSIVLNVLNFCLKVTSGVEEIYLLNYFNLCLDVNPFEGSSCRELRNLCGVQGYMRCVKMKPTLKVLQIKDIG